MTAFLNRISRSSLVLALLFAFGFSTISKASDAEEKPEKFNASEVIIHHVLDDHVWHLWDGHYGTIYLPVIVYSSEQDLDVFSSRNFYGEHHNLVEYKGYKLEHGHITLASSG